MEAVAKIMDAPTTELPGADVPGGSPTMPQRRRRGSRRGLIALVLALLLMIPAWSFSRAVLKSNGDPFSVKATEWARDHNLGSLVDRVEHYWYAHHQPPTGGLPKGGIPVLPRTVRPSTRARTRARTFTIAPRCPHAVVPIASPALPHEGAWQFAGRSRDVVCFAYMRPDAVHTSLVIGVAWMNMRMLTATLHNGTSLPGGGPWRAGPQISPSDYPRVVAAFNGGFRLDASRGGYYTEGRIVKPLAIGRASLVVFADGHVDVGMWGRDENASPNVVSVRQNLDLLVDGGRVTPSVTDANSRAWGATLGRRIFTWRSGVGVDAHGNLIYVAGPGLDVETLAVVLQRAGAVRAMELDINPEWTTLMVYTGDSPSTITPTKLLASMERPAARYLSSGSRDFIELDLRASPR